MPATSTRRSSRAARCPSTSSSDRSANGSPRSGEAGMEGPCPAIEVQGLSRRFYLNSALVKVDFAVGRGEVCGLIGSNGAGKTTLLRILATLLLPTSGRALVAGFDVRNEAAQVRKRIG